MAFDPSLFPGYNFVDPEKQGDYTWFGGQGMNFLAPEYETWAKGQQIDPYLAGDTPEIGWKYNQDAGQYYAGYKKAPAWQPSWAAGTLDPNMGMKDYLKSLGVTSGYYEDRSRGGVKSGMISLDDIFKSGIPQIYSGADGGFTITYKDSPNYKVTPLPGTPGSTQVRSLSPAELASLHKKAGLTTSETTEFEKDPLVKPYSATALPSDVKDPNAPIDLDLDSGDVTDPIETLEEKKLREWGEQEKNPLLSATPFQGLQESEWKSSFDPGYWETKYKEMFAPEVMAKQRADYVGGIEASLLPGFEKNLANQREQAIRQGGMSSGLISASQIEPTKAFQQNLATAGSEYGQTQEGLRTGFQSSIIETEAAANKEKVDFFNNQLVQEKSWDRNETSKVLGAEYSAKLSNFEFERNNAAQTERDRIEREWNQRNINKEFDYKKAQDDWNQTYVTAKDSMDKQMAILIADRDYAFKNNMFNKQTTLDREIAQLNRDMAENAQAASDDAAMWGGIGTIAVGVGIAI